MAELVEAEIPSDFSREMEPCISFLIGRLSSPFALCKVRGSSCSGSGDLKQTGVRGDFLALDGWEAVIEYMEKSLSDLKKIH